MKILEQNPILFLGVIWMIFTVTQAFIMPLFPIDETRYMTVAWEMFHRKNWILPTLNFESYSHKPPMLFWLINIVWSITGMDVWGIRIMNGFITFLSVILTYILAKNLFPAQRNIWRYAPVALMSSPMFFVFGTLIMFDFLQAIFVLLALIFLVKSDQSGKFIYWVLFGCMVGLGILSKGPVIFVHIAFPVLLAPLWASQRDLGQWALWYLKFGMAIAIAAIIALAWALQAAQLGGTEFSNEIFWSQSAGRMSKSFAHQKPFWFYIPILLLAFLPLVLWPHTWKAMIKNKTALKNSGIRFLLCWIIPTFIAFSCISGKQIHYLVPELGGIAILLTYLIFSTTGNAKEWPLPVLGGVVLFLVFYLAPLCVGNHSFYAEVFAAWDYIILTVFLGAFVVIALYLRGQSEFYIQSQLMTFVVMMFLIISLFSIQMSSKGYAYYDLRPFANELSLYKDQPVAVNRSYQGELGFLAKLEQPVERIDELQVTEWLDKHPGGVIIYRYNKENEMPDYDILFEMPYKSRSHIALVRN